MAYRIDNKFVSREKYEAHHAQKQEKQMTDTQDTAAVEETPARNVKPLVAATRRLTKAEKAFHTALAAVERATDVKTVFEAAKHEYEAAKTAVKELL